MQKRCEVLKGKKTLRLFLILFGFIFLTLLSLNNISAATCVITAPNDCPDNQEVIRISATTNAHGELKNHTNYANVICCDFSVGSNACATSNKTTGLSSQTNAHVEAPLITPNYNTNICYAGFEYCAYSTGNCVTADNETSVILLSNYTNAHIGTGYSNKMCCKVIPTPPPIPPLCGNGVINGVEQCDLGTGCNSTCGCNTGYISTSPVSVNCTQTTAPPGPCTITSASWSVTSARVGTNVSLNVATSNCAGKSISFAVFRNVLILVDAKCSDIDGCTNPSNATVGSNGNAQGTWTAGPVHDEKYYFVATIVGDASIHRESDSNRLTVSESVVDPTCEALDINICSDYTKYGTESETKCNDDNCDVADYSIPLSAADCSESGVNCFCAWNSTTSHCEAGWTRRGICGDGNVGPTEQCDDGNTISGDGCSSTCVLENGTSCDNDDSLDAGEFCDTTKLGGKNCTDFGFDSPNTLSCTPSCGFNTSRCISLDGFCGDRTAQNGETCERPGSHLSNAADWGLITGCANFGLDEGTGLICGDNCQFNTSLPHCTGTPGECDGGIVNPGETCDDDSISTSGLECHDFDEFTTGELSCDEECKIDTYRCGPSSTETGTCYYDEETTDTCEDDGYLTVNMTARWVGALDDPLAERCTSSVEALQCPAQVALPFFGLYNLLAALVLITAIYLIIETRRKKK